MNTPQRNSSLGTAVLSLWLFATTPVTAQNNPAPDVLLQRAIQTEMVDGDLPAAIKLYEQIATARGASRSVAASALLHLGQAYEKLGSAEARKAYERIARDFADQKDVATEAGRRLAALAAPSEEAAQLMAKAWAIWEKQDDITRDDLLLAEQWSERAVALAPDNGDAIALRAQISLVFNIFGFDMAPQRLEVAHTLAQRACRLAPDSIEPLLALGNYYHRQPATRAESVRILRHLAERAPTDKRVLRTLAAALRYQGKTEEAILVSDRAMALPGGDPVAAFGKEQALRFLGRWAEAEQVLDQALAMRPTPAGYLKKLFYALNIHGDLEQARALVEGMPTSTLVEEWGAATAAKVWLWRREPQRAIALMTSVPKDWLQRAGPDGIPRAGIIGMAQVMLGNREAAHASWETALQVVDQRLKTQSESADLIGWRALLLARLDRRFEAEQAGRTYIQALRSGATPTNPTRWTRAAAIEAMLGRPNEAVDILTKMVRRSPEGRNLIRYDPALDILVGDTRFDALRKSLESRE